MFIYTNFVTLMNAITTFDFAGRAVGAARAGHGVHARVPHHAGRAARRRARAGIARARGAVGPPALRPRVHPRARRPPCIRLRVRG